MDRIPVASPWITEREITYVREAAATAWNADHYRYNARFEAAMAERIGVAHAISLPSCTSALHLSLAALGIGPGDEVIVPDITWIASVAPVIQVGAAPVFADIDPVTWCLDPDSVRACLTPRSRAIIGVDLYGSMADWATLRALADQHGLALIEDAAEAIGSRLDGREAGGFGDTGTFSFHGSKTMTTGEGGMVVTDDAALHARMLRLRDHGRPPGDRFFLNEEVAFKYKMSALQAALGLAQLERLDALVARKREIFGWYRQHLGPDTRLVLNAEPGGVVNSFWMTTVIPTEETGWDKFALMQALEAQGIDTRPFFSRLSTLPAFADRPEAARFLPSVPAGTPAATRGINLPSGYCLTEAKVARICAALRGLLERGGP